MKRAATATKLELEEKKQKLRPRDEAAAKEEDEAAEEACGRTPLVPFDPADHAHLVAKIKRDTVAFWETTGGVVDAFDSAVFDTEKTVALSFSEMAQLVRELIDTPAAKATLLAIVEARYVANHADGGC